MRIWFWFADFGIRGQRNSMIRRISRCVEGSGNFAPYEDGDCWILDEKKQWSISFPCHSSINLNFTDDGKSWIKKDDPLGALYHWLKNECGAISQHDANQSFLLEYLENGAL